MRLAKSSSNHNFPLNFMSHHKLCKVWCRPKPIINDDTFPINRKNIIHFENFREREYGNGNRDIFSGTGTREREHGNGNRNIFLGNGNTGTGTENFFTGTGTGNGNGEKLFPQESTLCSKLEEFFFQLNKIMTKISIRGFSTSLPHSCFFSTNIFVLHLPIFNFSW